VAAERRKEIIMEEQKKTFSLLALIFGIAGIVLTFTPISIAGLVLAVLGIIFSVIAKKKEGKNGMNKAGFVLSLIALILWIVFIVIIGLLIAGTAALFGALM